MAYWKSSLRTQWYSKEWQPCVSEAQDEQFFFTASSLYDDRVEGHFVTFIIVSTDALQDAVKASKRFIYKQSVKKINYKQTIYFSEQKIENFC